MAITVNVSAPGAIPDLDTLKSTVSSYLDRADLDDILPQFILLAEAMFNRELRSPEMEKTATGSVTSEDTPLPSDYLAMRSIYIEGSPDRPLRGLASSALRQEFDGSAGTPVAYAIISGGLRFAPPPSDEILVTMDYWAKLDPLSVVAPSNWLLEKHPDAYLYATLFQAEAYLDNAVRAGQWSQLTEMCVSRINKTASNDRHGAGPLVPNAVAQVRGSRC